MCRNPRRTIYKSTTETIQVRHGKSITFTSTPLMCYHMGHGHRCPTRPVLCWHVAASGRTCPPPGGRQPSRGRACGLSRVTLIKGVEELQSAPLAPGRVRREGGGRHALTSNDPGLAPALDGMVEPTARGDPQSPLRWTCRSARTLAAELTARHHPVSHTKVTQLLREDGYSLQGNRKTEEGDDHPDRDAQFGHINRAVKHALRAGEPVISVDTKKKELIGNYQNQGRQWRQTGTAD